MTNISKLGKELIRHPKNRCGYCSPEFWEKEYELWGLTRQDYHRIRKEQSPVCQICGIPFGYAMGTGDCGCQTD